MHLWRTEGGVIYLYTIQWITEKKGSDAELGDESKTQKKVDVHVYFGRVKSELHSLVMGGRGEGGGS